MPLNFKSHPKFLASQSQKHLISSIYQIIAGLSMLIRYEDTVDIACLQKP